MTHPNVRCTRCGGGGQMKPTALDRLDLAETGVMDLQCLACDGTGQTALTPPPGLWCNRCQIITINATRCTVCGSGGLTDAPAWWLWDDLDHYLAVTCHRCGGDGRNTYTNPDDLCGACDGAGQVRKDGELL